MKSRNKNATNTTMMKSKTAKNMKGKYHKQNPIKRLMKKIN